MKKSKLRKFRRCWTCGRSMKATAYGIQAHQKQCKNKPGGSTCIGAFLYVMELLKGEN